MNQQTLANRITRDSVARGEKLDPYDWRGL